MKTRGQNTQKDPVCNAGSCTGVLGPQLQRANTWTWYAWR